MFIKVSVKPTYCTFTDTLKVKAECLSLALATIHQITPSSNPKSTIKFVTISSLALATILQINTVQQLKKYDIIRHYFVPSVGNHPSDYNAQYLKEHNIIIIEVQTCDICTLRAYICTHIRVEIKKYI